MKNILVAVFSFTLLVGLAGCGPSYYVPSQQADVIYEPAPPPIIVYNGQRGYYDSYHVFRPMIVINGQSGFYDSGHRFHSSSPRPNYSSAPNYSGPSTISRGPQTQSQQGQQAAPVAPSQGYTSSGPGRRFGVGATPASAPTPSGTISRGAPSAAPRASAPAPSYRSAPSGGMSRGTSTRR